MWPARLIPSFSGHHHGRRCTSCWAMTIVDQGKAPGHRKHELESGTGMCASMTPHRPTQRGSQELWEQRESQEGFPGEEALNWVLRKAGRESQSFWTETGMSESRGTKEQDTL